MRDSGSPVRLILRIVSTLALAGLVVLAVEVVTPLVGASVPASSPDRASRPSAARAVAASAQVASSPATWLEPVVDGRPWTRPDWYPDVLDVQALPALDEPGPREGPSVRARSAVVFDIDQGRILFEKNADNVRPVASITKLVSALALASLEPDLDVPFCIGAEQYPTRSGATSRLSTGDCLAGWDVLGAALVASDNRAAYGLAAAGGADIETFVGEPSAPRAPRLPPPPPHPSHAATTP